MVLNAWVSSMSNSLNKQGSDQNLLSWIFSLLLCFTFNVLANPIENATDPNYSENGDWTGSFESPKGVSLELTVNDTGYGGSLGIASNSGKLLYAVHLRLEQGRLEGVFKDASDAYAMTVEKGEYPDQIILRSGGSVYELSRIYSRSAYETAAPVRYSHPAGLFTLSLPGDWHATSYSPDVIALDTGLPGTVLLLLGQLEPHEIGLPLEDIMPSATEVVDQLLEDFQIYQITPRNQVTRISTGTLDGMVSERIGNTKTGQVHIWHSMAVQGEIAYMIIAALDSDHMDTLQSVLTDSFTSLQINMEALPQSSNTVADDIAPYGHNKRSVVFNGATLHARTLGQLELVAGQIPDGRYWYDRHSGMVGKEGGPTSAYFYANLDFCPQISPYASGAETRVSVNGRFLHPRDLSGLQMFLGSIQPGSYWLDQQGNYGYSGGPVMGNLLMQIAQVQNQDQGGGFNDSMYSNGTVYSRFPNLGASGSSVTVGGGMVNAGGVLWWPGK